MSSQAGVVGTVGRAGAQSVVVGVKSVVDDGQGGVGCIVASSSSSSVASPSCSVDSSIYSLLSSLLGSIHSLD